MSVTESSNESRHLLITPTSNPELIPAEIERSAAAIERSPTAEGTVVGFLNVPPHHDENAPYEEQWILFPEYEDALEKGSILSIEPIVAAPEELDETFRDRSRRKGVVYRLVTARREGLSAPGLAADDDACSLSPDDSELDYRTVWQKHSATSADTDLVGFVRWPRGGFTNGDELWCMTGKYRYPSPANGLGIELRPASNEELHRIQDEVRELPVDSAPAHGIRTSRIESMGVAPWVTANGQTRHSGPGASTGTSGCTFGPSNPSSGFLVLMAFVGLAFSSRRARRFRNGSRS